MAKVNISTARPGQMTVLDQLVADQLPVQAEAAAEAPAPGTSPVAPSAPETAPMVEEAALAGLDREAALEEQRQREQVPDIKTRRMDEARVDKYDFKGEESAKQATSAPSSDGGLSARAKNMAQAFEQGRMNIGGIGPHANNEMKAKFQNMGVVSPEGVVEPNFLMTMSAVTENMFAGTLFQEGEADVQLDDRQTAPEPNVNYIPKAVGNQELGNQIAQEYTRWRNKMTGANEPVQNLDAETANILGDMAKELYYDTNKTYQGEQFITRGQTRDGHVVFGVTKHGADLMAQGAMRRKRMFPKQHVRPSKTPLPGGELVGEGRLYTRRASGAKGGVIGADTLKTAMHNLASVANVVDPQRLKILFLTAMPVLAGKVGPEHPFSVINHVGQDKMNAFVAQQKKGTDPNYDAAQNYADIVSDLAQAIYGISNEKDGANYLSYYLQAATGRIAPQQTHFDPTTSKTVRFVTRNAVPAKATPGSRIERNLRQMYAMMLVKGADTLLPEGRERALERATPQLVKWGLELRSALDQISDADVDAIAEAIKQGTPVTDPNFPQLPDVEVNNPELLQAIESKGEDGQAFIDGLVDFANYYEAKTKGRPHYSYFNAYMDGKTNGLASNGIQLGSENMAYKTGVLRSQNEKLLDNDEDIRDQLAATNLSLLDEGFDGDVDKFGNELHNVAAQVFNDRTLNKATTMTFGYGMEMNSFKKTIDDRLAEMEEESPELAASVSQAIGDGTRQELIDAIHQQYIKGLAEVMDPEALKARQLMRGAALLHALTDELFAIESPTGFMLNMGGNVASGWEGGEVYRLWADGKRQTRTAGKYSQRATAAASKRDIDEEGEIQERPGGTAWGRSVVTPVQSIDAATVALTAAGKSWNKLRSASNGNPYLHTIYDAFKVDAMGYDVVLNEVNQNWLNSSMDWSYLEATKDSIKRLRETWAEKTKGLDPNAPVSGTQWAVAGWLLTPNPEARNRPTNLTNYLTKILPEDADANVATGRILQKMKARGFDYRAINQQPTVAHLNTFIKAFSDEINLMYRLEGMVRETDARKQKLKQKIRRDGQRVYQYYSH